MSQSPPLAPKRPHVEMRHGESVSDDYAWLRERDDPAVRAYLEAENAYTAAVMAPTAKLQETLYSEMLSRIQQTDLSVPVRVDDYFYYGRVEEGQQYRIHCRKRGSLDAAEEILLDENRLADGLGYFRLGAVEVSPNHERLAYAVDTDGSERYTLHICDLRTGQKVETIPGVYTGIEWAADNRTVFYSTLDATHRPYRLFRHVVGSDPAADVCVFQEDDAAFFLGLYKTKSRRFLMLHLGSNTTSEVHYLDAREPTGAFRVVEPRRQDTEYSVAHHDDRFFIVTNDEAVNFRLVATPLSTPGREHWADVLPARDQVKIDGIHVFADHIAVSEREAGLRELRVIELATGEQHRVDFPEDVYTVATHSNPEFVSDRLRFTYASPVTPPSVFDYDMRTREHELKKEEKVLGGYDRRSYRTERTFAVATDGTRIPISLVYKAGLPRDGTRPLLLYGYGAYGITIEPGFDSTRLSLLDRGFAFAIAHIRGGGTLGRPWYDDGKLLRKRNTFDDFIACAEHLIAERYTSPETLAIKGGSAGGLLVGAVANMRPDLFRAVIAAVPFVDVVSTMLDPSIPLTVIEREEWGDPRAREAYDYIASYSPYDNVRAQVYPSMLVTSGLNDPRVGYWEPAKWTARLRRLKTDRHPLLLKTDLETGHGGPSGRYDRLRELAFELAFLLGVVGLEARATVPS